MTTYLNFKSEVQLRRSNLKGECSKHELSNMIEALDKHESDVKQAYESLRVLTTPSPDIRRKMDSCVSVTTEMTTVLNKRHAEVGVEEFDAIAERETLQQLLERDDARSIYGSRAGQSSHHRSCVSSQTSQRRAEVAAQLASMRAAMKREEEIADQRRLLVQQQSRAKMELLTQQDRIKRLEAQRDLEAMEAEYHAYTEE